MKKRRSTRSIYARHHAVQFYGSEQSLFTTVAGFLSEGLVAGQPAIVIATESHRTGILEQLAGRFIDVEQATASGDLLAVDAHETLASFMAGDVPNPDVFKRSVGGLIERAIGGRQRTLARAYGEMVDLLWQSGLTEAAIRVEVLWNALAETHRFALLCGYSMGSFYKQIGEMEAVSRQHTHVIQPETRVVAFRPGRGKRSV